MDFKKCEQCGIEKTLKQFSMRNRNVCKACMMVLDVNGEVPINGNQHIMSPTIAISPSIHNVLKDSHTMTIRCREASNTAKSKAAQKKVIFDAGKVQPLIPNSTMNSNLTSASCNKMGITVIPTPTRPVIRGGSATYENLNEEQRRAILKAEYKARTTKAYREKKLLNKS